MKGHCQKRAAKNRSVADLGVEGHCQKRAAKNRSVADLALMPFIWQFAQVDRNWLEASPYVALREWLSVWEAADVFIKVMQKTL